MANILDILLCRRKYGNGGGVNSKELNLGYQFTYGNDDTDNNGAIYKENNTYFVKGFEGGKHFDESFDKFSEAEEYYNGKGKAAANKHLNKTHISSVMGKGGAVSEERAKQLATEWQDGVGSALYQFGSSGKYLIENHLEYLNEIQHELEREYHRATYKELTQKDAKELNTLKKYFELKGKESGIKTEYGKHPVYGYTIPYVSKDTSDEIADKIHSLRHLMNKGGNTSEVTLVDILEKGKRVEEENNGCTLWEYKGVYYVLFDNETKFITNEEEKEIAEHDGEEPLFPEYSKGGSVKQTTAQRKKVTRVMREFGKGKLTSHGKVVKDHKQAVAIALHSANIPKKK